MRRQDRVVKAKSSSPERSFVSVTSGTKNFKAHTFATRLRAKGVHEMDIMSLLGHTTLQMRSRYTQAMPQKLRIS